VKNTVILEASGVCKEFLIPKKIAVLSDINLRVHQGETLSIIGPSGCGKSTLLHILGTLESPSKGELIYFGKPCKKSSIPHLRNKEIGFVFQSGNLLEEYTLLENLLIKAKIARRSTEKHSASYKEAVNLLDQVGLGHRIEFPVKYLSGGEKQRASIARAFMNDPHLVLADEPTGNLDETQASSIQELLTECCRAKGKSLVVVTHDPHFARLCDHVYELENGILIQEQTPQSTYIK
jgi:lipoprotein-releasing system ATP-binding protein